MTTDALKCYHFSIEISIHTVYCKLYLKILKTLPFLFSFIFVLLKFFILIKTQKQEVIITCLLRMHLSLGKLNFIIFFLAKGLKI